MKRFRYWGSLLCLTLLISFIWQHGLQADEPTPQDDDGPQTILGEATQGTAVSPSSPTPIPEEMERPLGDQLLYLPIIINQKLGPEAQAVVDLVNAERASAGCAPLQVNLKLAAAAQGHSEDMAINDFFDHVGSNGSTVGQRIAAQGYSYSTWAENIAAGYGTAAAAVDGWMTSDGHRANIQNCNLQETGVGYFYLQNDTGNVNYGRYWTQVFASP